MKFLLIFSAFSIFPSVFGEDCAGGWTRFERSSGPWCMRVFYGVFTKNVAAQQCSYFKAVLSGFENDEERMAVANAARAIIIENRRRTEVVRVAGLWLGAYRNGTCVQDGSCTRATSWKWTDGHTNGLSGMKFPTGRPSGVPLSCLQQIVIADSNTYPTWPGYQHGDVAETSCVLPMNPHFRMYVCGKNVGVL